jgi:hypothetical protein
VEHFIEILNCTDPLSSADPTPVAEDIHVDTSPQTLGRVQKAINLQNNYKSVGINFTNSDLLKAVINTSSRIFHNLFINMENETSIWLFKRSYCQNTEKRDLQNCDNWKGVTLLSVPSKVFCKIILATIDEAVVSKPQRTSWL